jgi:hypothetical protein
MRHGTNARVEPMVIQAVATIVLWAGHRRSPVNDATGPGEIALTNNKTGAVKNIPSYSETE